MGGIYVVFHIYPVSEGVLLIYVHLQMSRFAQLPIADASSAEFRRLVNILFKAGMGDPDLSISDIGVSLQFGKLRNVVRLLIALLVVLSVFLLPEVVVW